MAKFPTEVEDSIIVEVPKKRAYEYLWDVVGSAACIHGLRACRPAGEDTYEFLYEERSTGPMSMVVRYTAHYEGNGRDRIEFESIDAPEDNTEVRGTIALESAGRGKTRVTLRQMIAPDTPIPRLMQGLVRSFVEKEARDGLHQYLENVRYALEKS